MRKKSRPSGCFAGCSMHEYDTPSRGVAAHNRSDADVQSRNRVVDGLEPITLHIRLSWGIRPLTCCQR